MLLVSPPPTFGQTKHILKATPQNVVIGYYDATTPPASRIHSGDTVEIQALGVGTPDRMVKAGLDPKELQPELKAVVEASKTPPRGHFLTGPVFIEGAEPGDVLEVHILSIRMDLPYAFNGMGGSGALVKEFPKGGAKIIRLDRKRKVGLVAPGVEVPLRPFFGSMGDAPPLSAGRVSSRAPSIFAGNMDNRYLVAGTTLFIPIHAAGALFQVGDGHAAQGDGEADQTGLETSLTGTFRFVVRKDMKLKLPRAETPTHYITMGFNEDLDEAMHIASVETLDFLTTEKKLSPDDAYMLMSVGVDFHVTQVVDGNKGVHAMIPKSIFKSVR
ncbi:MAG TPA: acetamidase/formamidase family protein [Bryobacteraceae bacterium]